MASISAASARGPASVTWLLYLPSMMPGSSFSTSARYLSGSWNSPAPDDRRLLGVGLLLLGLGFLSPALSPGLAGASVGLVELDQASSALASAVYW